ncbi:hypothetical protein AB4Y32_07430 [Paraburkholderia phymatum]|uniref:Uncharacterized protein n=1 Tax=Paraburkholderia phymatum TaxID=148447 RepID=A0ACC6TWB6_9BURK
MRRLEDARWFGRERKMADSKIASARKLLAGGVPLTDLASNPGMSVQAMYRWMSASAYVFLVNAEAPDHPVWHDTQYSLRK